MSHTSSDGGLQIESPLSSAPPVRAAIGLGQTASAQSAEALNRLLAHTMAMCDLYQKVYQQTHGATFHELHRLFDKHHGEQAEIRDSLAGRVQALGGVALVSLSDVTQESRFAAAPPTPERVVDQLRRLVYAHGIVLEEARQLSQAAIDRGDSATNDLIVSEVVLTNELQCWFIAEHLMVRDHEAGAIK